MNSNVKLGFIYIGHHLSNQDFLAMSQCCLLFYDFIDLYNSCKLEEFQQLYRLQITAESCEGMIEFIYIECLFNS